ncbi:MAG TPA: DUF6338 family protein [Streptosporangiaceae bacterium]|jgi:hypothetical protein|nr:DUF6338 family protein [Streptosporangiaceae bacterium]
MPTTLTGLLLFVALLLPGFAYLVGKERNGTERHTSPFRETVAIVAASVTSEVAVLAVFAILRWLLPSLTPDVGALIHHGSTYAAVHYRSLAAWGFGMLAIAVLGAYLATMPGVREHLPLTEAARDYPHESTVSAWWMLFDKWRKGRDIEVCCILTDGSAVRGKFGSFNPSADDSPDRELLLHGPLRYRAPGKQEMGDYRASAASVAARNIAVLFTFYDGEPQIRPKHWWRRFLPKRWREDSAQSKQEPALLPPGESGQVPGDQPPVPLKAG